MKVTRKILIVFFLTAIYVINAFGDDASFSNRRGKHHGPPPEAYSACEGKNTGDTAQFVSPRGETVTGTCEQEGDRLVLRPDRSKRNSSGRHHGPPQEAYTACEGKSAGDEAQFVSSRGETVTGTCEQEGDRLVLRPDRSKRNSSGRHHGPPQEAYTACEGKSAGDEAQFISPRGETVTGTCEQEGDRLVLRPVYGKGNAAGRPMNKPND